MGLSREQVERETVASLWTALQGFKQFHGVKSGDAVGDDEFLTVLAAEQAAGRA